MPSADCDEVRKRLFAHFLYVDMSTFTKTGSGQTHRESTQKRTLFAQAAHGDHARTAGGDLRLSFKCFFSLSRACLGRHSVVAYKMAAKTPAF
eukprot:COSAG06_NODE_39165_length_415_cov_1.620253_1_plen_93_part_01